MQRTFWKNNCSFSNPEPPQTRNTHLAGINVGAIRVNLRVVCIEHCRVDASRTSDCVTGVTKGDNMGGSAILAVRGQAEGLAGHKVGAACVNLFDIVDGKLVATRVQIV